MSASIPSGSPVMVTGAGRGLGRAIALELARRGLDVIATMRDPRTGEQLAAEAAGRGEKLRVVRLDVDRPETIDLPAGLRVLVNNAGIECAYLPVEAQPLDDWRRVFETNVFGLVEVTRRAIPLLRAAGGGVICNVTSSSILAPMPFYSVYRASKAAASALGESLRAELSPFGIRVLEILPGPIETDMLARSDRLPEAAGVDGYGEMAEKAYAARRNAGSMTTPAAEAARRIADAILDDTAPLRVPCDPLAEMMLTGADATGHEARMHGWLAAMGFGN